MRLRLLGYMIFIFSACNGQPQGKITYVKNYEYKIIVRVGSSFWDLGTTYVLDNSAFGRYDSIDAKQGRLKPLTLYCMFFRKPDESGIAELQTQKLQDTIAINFSIKNSDKLFRLTRNFFQRLPFNNIDTLVNGTKTSLEITDDASANVEVDFNGRKLYASISSISNPSISTKEFAELLRFIQKFRPAQKQ